MNRKRLLRNQPCNSLVWNEAVVQSGGHGLQSSELLAFHLFLCLSKDLRVDRLFVLQQMPENSRWFDSTWRCQFVSSLYSGGVTANAKTRRRWFGTLCLVTAVVMLIAGETAIKGRLAGSGVLYICYWLGCLVLTGLAAGAAVVDAARVRAGNRDEQRALIESTLHAIEREKRARKDVKE